MEYPIAASWAQAECLICDYTCLSGAFGGSFVDENNNHTLNSTENVQALDFVYYSEKTCSQFHLSQLLVATIIAQN